MSENAPVAETYEEIGSGMIGDGFLSIRLPPLCMGITVTQTDITVRGFWKRYRLPREAITRLWRSRVGLIGNGWPTVALDHSLKDVPIFVFYPLDYGTLKTNLERFGYTVHEENHRL